MGTSKSPVPRPRFSNTSCRPSFRLVTRLSGSFASDFNILRNHGYEGAAKPTV